MGAVLCQLDLTSTPALDNSATVFTAGIAAGMSFERQRGRLRVEVEGLGRDYYQSAYTAQPGSAVMVNNWSVTANAWRDFMFTERFGLYGGGGIGGGGYRLGDLSSGSLTYYEPAATFAWQAGGGLIYELSDRLTFDVSYRYIQFDVVQQPSAVSNNQFSASEVMFGLRLFEPFRSLRR
jgi:opacity protein-like surface antigen